ncbi:MAG: hypothetical protein AVO35_11080 [Candidatus Aegiribacteria sp. MLS_C]|nr:MAG: hypothetical protein AVO35_11080 [Candidatus Aegiribacteria sp. MLS_C]
MRYLAALICFAVLAFAGMDGQTGSSAPMESRPVHGTDGITLTVENTFDPVTKALGLDIIEDVTFTYVLGTNNEDLVVQAYDAYTGNPLGSLPLDPANGSCFGVAWNNDLADDTYYTSDWNSTSLFYTDDFGLNWSTYPSPAGDRARGMDFDGTDYWTTNGTGGGLWRFQPGVGESNLAIPEVTGQPSGVTTFPYEGDVGVAVTTYSDHSVWFYVWDGASLTYLGSAPCPLPCSSSYGLAYSSNTDTIFWSYRDTGNNYKISELSFDISVALQQETWGSIKTTF